jgi:hypothetical protein
MTVNGEVQKYIVQHKDAPIMNTEMEKGEVEGQKVEIKTQDEWNEGTEKERNNCVCFQA